MDEKVKLTETQATQARKGVGLIQVLVIGLILVLLALGAAMMFSIGTDTSPENTPEPSAQTTR